MCPWFDSQIWHHMWIEFIVGSRPCSEGFSPGSPVFLPPQKPAFLNSNSIGDLRATGLSVEDCCVSPSLKKVDLLFICIVRSLHSAVSCLQTAQMPTFNLTKSLILIRLPRCTFEPYNTQLFFVMMWLTYADCRLSYKWIVTCSLGQYFISLFQALGQWGWSKKRAGDNRDQLRAGTGSEKERAGEPVSIVLKTSFPPLEKRNHFLCQNVKCQDLHMISIELLVRVSRGHADLHSVLCSSVIVYVTLLCLRESLWVWKSLCRHTEN